MATIDNYIESQYRLLVGRINIEYLDLYQSFSSQKIREIFSTIHHIFVDNYTAMNSRLPTDDYGNHFWADNSRDLILAIEVLRELEKVLKNTEYAFIIDPYYEQITQKSMGFLVKSGGSEIPPHMDKVEIYYTDPILRKKDAVILSSTSTEQQYADLKQIGAGSYATVYSYNDPFYNRKFVIKRAKADLAPKEIERFKQEYEQMNKLHSPYIVEVYQYNLDKNEYIMESMDCTLSDYIINSNPKPNGSERKGIVQQVFKAFKYIHSKNLLHRDISPNNILIKKYDDVNVIKVADFGLVKVSDSTLTSWTTKFKGSFNDLTLISEGFSTYSMVHETYALTKLVSFIMTGSAMPREDFDEKLKLYVKKGLSSDNSQRYQSVDEMAVAFKNL